MKRVLALMLVAVMIFSFAGVAIAAEPISKVLDSTNIVNVTGQLTEGGQFINVLLKDGEEVKYINDFPVEADGSYRAKFKYPSDIAGLTLQVKQGNEDKTSSVVSAISEKEAVSYELNVINSNKTYVTVEIENYFNVAGKTYTVLLAYYGENNKLLDVFVRDEKQVAKDKTTESADYDIPEGTKKIKVFMWDSIKTMIPLAKEVTGRKNDTIRVLSIGNSFADDSVAYLDEIAAEDGVELIIRKANYGGGSIKTHRDAMCAEGGAQKIYEKVDDVPTKSIDDFLEEMTYDYITVQQASADSGMYETYIEDGIDDMLCYLREKQPTAEIVFHATWAYEKGSTHSGFANYNGDQLTMHNAILDTVTRHCERVKDLKTESGLSISLDGKPLRYIPTGIAFMKARENPMFDTEYIYKDSGLFPDKNPRVDTTVVRTLHRDSYHSSYNYGRYLTALTWYAALSGNSVLDNKFSHKTYPLPEDARPVIVKAANDAVRSTGIWN